MVDQEEIMPIITKGSLLNTRSGPTSMSMRTLDQLV